MITFVKNNYLVPSSSTGFYCVLADSNIRLTYIWVLETKKLLQIHEHL